MSAALWPASEWRAARQVGRQDKQFTESELKVSKTLGAKESARSGKGTRTRPAPSDGRSPPPPPHAPSKVSCRRNANKLEDALSSASERHIRRGVSPGALAGPQCWGRARRSSRRVAAALVAFASAPPMLIHLVWQRFQRSLFPANTRACRAISFSLSSSLALLPFKNDDKAEETHPSGSQRRKITCRLVHVSSVERQQWPN